MNSNNLHSKLTIERYSAGEFDAATRQAIEVHCASCALCNSYFLELTNDRKTFLNLHPASELVSTHKEAATSAQWLKKIFAHVWKPQLIPAYGLVAALLIMVPVISHVYNPKEINKIDTISYKGSATLSFAVERAGKIFEGNPLDTFMADDKIQIFYPSDQKQYIALVSVDSYGSVSFYHADQQSTVCSIPTAKGPKLVYPASMMLDDSHGQELVLVLLSPKQLTTKDVRAWIMDTRESVVSSSMSTLAARLQTTAHSVNATALTVLLNKR